ncbi:hypothetical protein NDU88_001843 [Pleurodeles waltl]|uniref:Uncharacterized protein n=1 Tax=Pleurodeles waltl TaxID=8319 RepID=A0AAV7NC02_PLEWA|nr:hypothetical protein NDU88_001843 [Pleurodeles waltl]
MEQKCKRPKNSAPVGHGGEEQRALHGLTPAYQGVGGRKPLPGPGHRRAPKWHGENTLTAGKTQWEEQGPSPETHKPEPKKEAPTSWGEPQERRSQQKAEPTTNPKRHQAKEWHQRRHKRYTREGGAAPENPLPPGTEKAEAEANTGITKKKYPAKLPHLEEPHSTQGRKGEDTHLKRETAKKQANSRQTAHQAKENRTANPLGERSRMPQPKPKWVTPKQLETTEGKDTMLKGQPMTSEGQARSRKHPR